jgi:hypothetical protein
MEDPMSHNPAINGLTNRNPEVDIYAQADALIIEVAEEIRKLRDAIGHATIALGELVDRHEGEEWEEVDRIAADLAEAVM